MEQKQFYKKSILVMLIVCIMLSIFCVFGQFVNLAYAETPNSTNVLDDLNKDENFNIEDYPDNSEDYSIDLFQIAESTSKELLVYTYQPCLKTCFMSATSINMSLSDKVADTKLYSLELICYDGVFCKYKVKDVKVADTDYRYYNITSIYRSWNPSVDKGSGNDNTIDEVAYKVGKLFKSSTINGKVIYSYDKMETIEILNPYVDFIEYPDGWHFFPTSCRNHYIAFDTDKKIDELMEAGIYFVKQDIIYKVIDPIDKYEKGEKLSVTKTLKGCDKGETPAGGLFAKKYEWELIEKTADFIKNPNNRLKDSTIENIKDTKWILRFENTIYEYQQGIAPIKKYTEISEVSILRLKFRTGVKIYDLGVVSNKITGDDYPGNIPDNSFSSFFGWLADKMNIPEWAVILIFVLIIIAILLSVLSAIFPVVGQVLKIVFKVLGKALEWLITAIIWLIELPIKGIALLINKIKGGGSA